MVDRNGISGSKYRAPFTVAEIVEESGSIMCIDEETELFKKQLNYLFAAVIVLRLSRIKINCDGYLLIPTCNFFAKIQYVSGNKFAARFFDLTYSVCAIHAIGGSAINKKPEFKKNTISIRHVSIDLKGKRVSGNAPRDFEEGKIRGVICNNGSGKTVLLKSIYGTGCDPALKKYADKYSFGIWDAAEAWGRAGYYGGTVFADTERAVQRCR